MMKIVGEESTSEHEMTNGKESEVNTTPSRDEECFECQEVNNCEENKLSIPVSQESDNYVETETNFPPKCSGDSCPCYR